MILNEKYHLTGYKEACPVKKKCSPKELWILFKSMFILSSCTFGGGFVVISLMKKKFVEELGWLEEDEMLDITAITQASPGPLFVNAAVIVGYRMHGISGSVIAALGTIIPPMAIISLICAFYTQFRENRYISIALQVMRAGVAAVIVDVTINLAKNVCSTRSVFYILLMTAAFISTCILKISAIYIILICLAIGIADAALTICKKKGGSRE